MRGRTANRIEQTGFSGTPSPLPRARRKVPPPFGDQALKAAFCGAAIAAAAGWSRACARLRGGAARRPEGHKNLVCQPCLSP
jgi:hypothetical protein